MEVFEFIATLPTRLKASDGHSAQLASNDKKAVLQGARLTAKLASETDEYWLIEDGILDGKALEPHLTYLFKAHWEKVQSPDSVAAAQLTEERLIAGTWNLSKMGDPANTMPLYFLPNGKLKGSKIYGENIWVLEDGELRLFNQGGRLVWRFTSAYLQDGVTHFVGVLQLNPKNEGRAVLCQYAAAAGAKPAVEPARPSAAETPEGDPADDKIKMIIWDLDDTFWTGTLAEGGMKEIPLHTQIVKEMSSRGIVNSICSKNHFEPVRETLTGIGLWEHFIFPKIAFAPKGEMIREIIENAQLRAPSVLFIDDNIVNINEALHYNPGLQVCLPEAIEGLLTDRRCKGKPDPELKRLAQYKILETKARDKVQVGSENLDFLRQSQIRVSFHHDVEQEFTRIHDMVNRTNQLNFTKRRWPEDEAGARAAFEAENSKTFSSHSGYVKVSDRYGNYGICGFYLVSHDNCVHFLFSCRTLNMGIEQFVWHRIGRPELKIVGEVVANIGALPDWITVVEDADLAPEDDVTTHKPLISVRGACDLSMMSHYLRIRFEINEEFPFPYQGWGIHPAARAIAVYDDIKTPAGQELIKKLPGIPPRRFESAIHTGAADVYVISFSSEVFGGHYRSKSTGIILPFHHSAMSGKNFADTSYATLVEKKAAEFDEAAWDFLRQEFEFVGSLDTARLDADVRKLFSKLTDKIVIVLMLNAKVGSQNWILTQFDKINSVVRPITASFGYYAIDLNELVKDTSDLVDPKDGGAHFNRSVYMQLAKRVGDIVTQHGKAKSPALAPAA
jgi:FkbH-like protein